MTEPVKLDPNKKYVLVFNEPMADSDVRKWAEKFEREFLDDRDKAIAVIVGDATVVPADQVVGCVPFGGKGEGCYP